MGNKKKQEERYPFFVYGTLRHGCGNYYNCLVGRTSAEIPGTVKGVLCHKSMLPVAFEGEGTIKGEVMYIAPGRYPRVLRDLDRLEGFMGENESWNFYNRKLVDVKLETGETVKAWMYFYNGKRDKNAERIESGDYVEWRAQSNYVRFSQRRRRH